ncbi:magnesium-translocating P-type ATPase [Yinghuangia seranimata]|uniref:magnesium-translocating P-type ATPase n=1 Tax=Yinghuangia seranimata TaxID=408067 RepID=UPI00248B04ED|nr:magnesium-translocating P-type ATPase [Yinghuangia seranimata]MDI2128376.1 magnesium-translocating P-type ATPase [Yinghuangia seranimata]
MLWAADRLGGAGTHAPAPRAPSDVEGLTRFELLRRLDSGPRGLTDDEAELRLARFGENELPGTRTPGALARTARGLRDPFTGTLLVLGLVSMLVASWATACVIASLVVVSCVLRSAGEYRAERASAALRGLVASTVTVRRRVREDAPVKGREVPSRHLVPGDVVSLGPGDLVPADMVLLQATGFTVHQGALTGESAPVAKHAVPDETDAWARAVGPPRLPDQAPFGQPHLCFQGSSVVTGSATALVVATGSDTWPARGRTGRQPTRAVPTAFDRAVDGIAWILIRFMLLTPPLVLMANAVLRGRGVETLPFAVAVAVGLTPEMLPVIVTTALSRGATRLAEGDEVIVRRAPALHNAGAMDVLCVDKTGTLTEDRPTLHEALDAHGRPDAGVLELAALNSWWTVHLAELPVPDPLDEALLEHDTGAEDLEGVSVLPFDPIRRLATAVVRDPRHWARHTVVTKGAVDAVLGRCTSVRTAADRGATAHVPHARTEPDAASPGVRPLDDDERTRLAALAGSYAAEGLRVLAVATAQLRPTSGTYTHAHEHDLAFVGFVTFRDAVADTAHAALGALTGQGVAVKVLTGDHPGTAARVCRELGLEPGRIALGPEVDTLDDAALADLAAATTVFAYCTPQHKARIVDALRREGHTVGFLGDGVNDLPALRSADVALCPRGAVDVAREASDVVLADKDLTAISRTVAEGRRSSANIACYLRITISSNLGNVIAMLAAGVILPFLPMLPVQVLVQNLAFDIAQLSLAFDRPRDADLKRPLTLRSGRFLRFVTVFGALNAAADLATFGVLHWSTDSETAFHAGWFTENLLTQAVVIVLLRSGTRAAHGSVPRAVQAALCGLAAVGLAVPVSPLAPALGMSPLPPVYYGLLGLVLAAYAAVLAAVRPTR